MARSHILGFPRIGVHREMKKAIEAYWSADGTCDSTSLEAEGEKVRLANWQEQINGALDWITVGDFSWYDHVLDMSALCGVIPKRFGKCHGEVSFDTYLRMARGRAPSGADTRALEMTKWFDTNYHYIVPEFSKSQVFKISSSKLFKEVAAARQLSDNIKPVLIGPVTYLWLGKMQEAGDKFDLLPQLLVTYAEILRRLATLGITWVQIDEPILALDLPTRVIEAFSYAYSFLQSAPLSILLTTYFGPLGSNLEFACRLPVAGLHIDAATDRREVFTAAKLLPKESILSVGLVNGRNIWRHPLHDSLKLLAPLHADLQDRLWVASSCSLLHCPIDLREERLLDEEFKSWLSFGIQKIQEIACLKRGLNEGISVLEEELRQNDAAIASRKSSPRIHNPAIKQRCGENFEKSLQRPSDYTKRSQIQKEFLKLPLLPTTTIGSFPQTKALRRLHKEYQEKLLSSASYTEQLFVAIADLIRKQEALGLDVLVHGELERSDMVEYFGMQLEGFAVTENGWVQAYGSRCVKPPIIFGDVERRGPMTVEWIRYAQSLTEKPVKGMLTGPTTLLRWSFVRDDQSEFDTIKHIASALREEVRDLQEAGIKIIQIDEPAFREGMPLKKELWKAYFDQAIFAFKLASCVADDKTQIHTHMCYSEFNDIIAIIAGLDADVISIEASRSNMELLKAFEHFCYPNDIGPGIYDIHSPLVPSVEEMFAQIIKAATLIPMSQLWVNPDCGLKTRSWPEVEAALSNMVAAAKAARRHLSQHKN